MRIKKQTKRFGGKQCIFYLLTLLFILLNIQTAYALGYCRGQRCACAADYDCANLACVDECNGHNWGPYEHAPSCECEEHTSYSYGTPTWDIGHSYSGATDVSNSEQTRERTDRKCTPYTATSYTTHKYANMCSVWTCQTEHNAYYVDEGHSDSSGTNYDYETTTEYRFRGYTSVYYQDTNGNYQLAYDDAGSWSDWNEDRDATSTTYSWSESSSGTHYAADTFSDDSSIDVTISSSTTREFTRYIHRKQWVLYLFPNPHSDASTSVVNQNLSDGWALQSGGYFERRCYVGENFIIPTPFDAFRMIGYMTNDNWYMLNSDDVLSPGRQTLVTSLPNHNSPNYADLYKYSVKAIWFSEPGQIWLMPNSNQGSTDSNYAGYIENDNKNADTYLHGDKSMP